GFALGAVGALVAFVYGFWHLGELRLPPARRYPAAVLNSVGTSFIDEAVFRGIILGLLVAAEVPVELAIVVQALGYALITRVAARDRPVGVLLLSLAVGLVGGWVTIETAGIGAAFLGHALTRLALFVATGHAGHVYTPAEEEPLPDARELTPDGWEIVGDRGPGPGSFVDR
ncbi:MAG: CPBP family glutamic-type intramembrane protease, partial [Chloroflexota bacterium]|nr:CPBP family glutamic-type intramembrane protease [Chloroflexota bacterium]